MPVVGNSNNFRQHLKHLWAAVKERHMHWGWGGENFLSVYVLPHAQYTSGVLQLSLDIVRCIRLVTQGGSSHSTNTVAAPFMEWLRVPAPFQDWPAESMQGSLTAHDFIQSNNIEEVMNSWRAETPKYRHDVDRRLQPLPEASGSNT